MTRCRTLVSLRSLRPTNCCVKLFFLIPEHFNMTIRSNMCRVCRPPNTINSKQNSFRLKIVLKNNIVLAFTWACAFFVYGHRLSFRTLFRHSFYKNIYFPNTVHFPKIRFTSTRFKTLLTYVIGTILFQVLY